MGREDCFKSTEMLVTLKRMSDSKVKEEFRMRLRLPVDDEIHQFPILARIFISGLASY